MAYEADENWEKNFKQAVIMSKGVRHIKFYKPF